MTKSYFQIRRDELRMGLRLLEEQHGIERIIRETRWLARKKASLKRCRIPAFFRRVDAVLREAQEKLGWPTA